MISSGPLHSGLVELLDNKWQDELDAKYQLMDVQLPIAALGRATWYKANAWRSTIDCLKGGRRRDGWGLHTGEIAMDCLAAWGI